MAKAKSIRPRRSQFTTEHARERFAERLGVHFDSEFQGQILLAIQRGEKTSMVNFVRYIRSVDQTSNRYLCDTKHGRFVVVYDFTAKQIVSVWNETGREFQHRLGSSWVDGYQ